jgi:fructose-1-phosphate kinase PfkB-like protein
MAAILVAGVNPAWQHVLSLPSLRPGAVNRARESWSLASGKGINAAKALSRLGHSVSVLQVLAGENGRRCLKDCAAWKLRSLHVRAGGETRSCVTLLSEEDGSATEVVGPFHADEPLRLARRLLRRVPPGARFDAVLICGTLPAGFPESLYADLLDRVEASYVVWDSVTGLTNDLLKRIAWIKVNAEEFRRLSLPENAAHPAAMITDGASPARVLGSRSADGAYRLPPLRGARNPIGAGDVVTALVADGLLRGLDEETLARRALAFGSASCLSPLPGEFDPARAETLEPEIRREAA